MRIALPVRNLTLGKAGGVETYARCLISELQKLDSANEYDIICSALNEEAFPVSAPNFRKIVVGGGKLLESLHEKVTATLGDSFPARVTSQLNDMVSGLKKQTVEYGDRYDISHYLFDSFPPGTDLTPATIITISDIQHEYYPEFFSSQELERRAACNRPSAEKAEHIIAISEFTKKSIVEKYRVPPEKITIVNQGYDSGAFKQLKKEEIEAFRKKYQLPESFLLYPAATWPHKNHINLVRAYNVLKERHGFKGKLVLTGIKKENSGKMEEEIGLLGLEKDIIRLGYLPYGDLPLLYNAASLMVFPSLFEGFGIPVVEAFGSGLPVACSNTTSLPEVAGDAALLFDPNDPEDMAEKVHSIWKDQELRTELIERGLRRAGEFTWKRTAEKTLRVYEKVYLERKR